MPRQIPNSSWYVVSNNSTLKKAAIAREVCRLLGHPEEECLAASKAIDHDTDLSVEFKSIPSREDDEDPFKI